MLSSMSSSRRLIIGFVAMGFIILNPIHLPFSLPYLTTNMAGTELARFLSNYEQQIVIGSTVYFTAVMIPIYYWLWKRRRGASKTTASRAPAAQSAASSDDSAELSYRGRGGGKRLPPSLRNRGRRRRR